MKNFGFLEEPQLVPQDWRFGGVSGAIKQVLREDGNYSEFLPDNEYQIGVYFDTLACVTFSALNCLETIARVRGMKWNKSDRFTAKISGTTKEGNYFRKVAESLRVDGVVDEAVWPYPRTQRDPVFDWDDFYIEIPEEIKIQGKQWLAENTVQWEWVPVSNVRELLKYGPIQVSVYAWPHAQANGMYSDNGNTKRNHAVMLLQATDEYYEIFDHYDKTRKKLVPNYRFGSAIQFSIIKNDEIPMPTVKLTDNILVQDSEAGRSGAFAMHLEGKLWVGSNADVMATVVMRSPKKIIDGESFVLIREPRGLKAAEWDSFDKVNMKGQLVEPAKNSHV